MKLKFRLVLLLMLVLGALVACAAPAPEEAEEPEPEAAEEEMAEEEMAEEEMAEEEAEPEAEEEMAEEEMAEEEASAPEGDPIVIGGTLGLTGAFAGPSAEYQIAYDLWLEEVNARGGLLGRPVEIIIYDDESTPATAQALYNRLINEDEVDLLLAPYTTFIGGSIIPIAEDNEMVLWNGGFVGIDLFINSDWVVGSYTYQEPQYVRPVFEYVRSLPEDERPQTMAVLTAQNPFTLVVRDGYNGEEGVLNYAEELGIEIVLNEEYPGNTTDFTSLIQRARAEEADMLMALTLPNDGAAIARTVEELDYNPTIYCSCGSQVTTIPFWKDLGPAGENVMSTAMGWPTDDFNEIDLLQSHFEEELGYSELPSYATVAYAILQVIEQAVNESESLDQAELRDFVTNNSFETVNGTIAYDDNRIPEFNAVGVQFQDGQNVIYWPDDRATGEAVFPRP